MSQHRRSTPFSQEQRSMDSDNTVHTNESELRANQPSSRDDMYSFPPLPGMTRLLPANARQSGGDKQPRSSRSTACSSRRTVSRGSRTNDGVGESVGRSSMSEMRRSQTSGKSSHDGRRRHHHSSNSKSSKSKRRTSISSSFAVPREGATASTSCSRYSMMQSTEKSAVSDGKDSVVHDGSNRSTHAESNQSSHTMLSRGYSNSNIAPSRSVLHSSELQPSLWRDGDVGESGDVDSQAVSKTNDDRSNNSITDSVAAVRNDAENENGDGHAVIAMGRSDASLLPPASADFEVVDFDPPVPSRRSGSVGNSSTSSSRTDVSGGYLAADHETSLPHEIYEHDLMNVKTSSQQPQSVSQQPFSALPPSGVVATAPLSSSYASTRSGDVPHARPQGHFSGSSSNVLQRQLSSRYNSGVVDTPVRKASSMSMRDYAFDHSMKKISDASKSGANHKSGSGYNSSSDGEKDKNSNHKKSKSSINCSNGDVTSMSQHTMSRKLHERSASHSVAPTVDKVSMSEQDVEVNDDDDDDEYTYSTVTTHGSESEMQPEAEEEAALQQQPYRESQQATSQNSVEAMMTESTSNSSHPSRQPSNRERDHSGEVDKEEKKVSSSIAATSDVVSNAREEDAEVITRQSWQSSTETSCANSANGSSVIPAAADASRASTVMSLLGQPVRAAEASSRMLASGTNLGTATSCNVDNVLRDNSSNNIHLNDTTLNDGNNDGTYTHEHTNFLENNSLANPWNAVGRDSPAISVPLADLGAHPTATCAENYPSYDGNVVDTNERAPSHWVGTPRHNGILNIGEVEMLMPLPSDSLHPVDKFFLNFNESTKKMHYQPSYLRGRMDQDSGYYGAPMNEDEMLFEQFAEFTDDDSLYSSDGNDVRATTWGRRDREWDYWGDDAKEEEGMRLGSLHGLRRRKTNKDVASRNANSNNHDARANNRASRRRCAAAAQKRQLGAVSREWMDPRLRVPPHTVHAALDQNSCETWPYNKTSPSLRQGYCSGDANAAQSKSQQAGVGTAAWKSSGVLGVIGRCTGRVFDQEWLYQVHRSAVALEHSSLFIFHPRSVTRVMIYNILHHSMMELFVLVSIVMYMTFEASCNRHPDSQTGLLVKPVYMHFADTFFTALLLLECLARLYANGAVLHQHAYFRNWWRWLDTVVLVMMIMQCSNHPVLWNYTALRLLRAVKCLTCSPMPTGMKMIAKTVLRSANQLLQVMCYMIFFIIFFALVGVQVFGGGFHSRCVNTITGVVSNKLCQPRDAHSRWFLLTGFRCGPLEECRSGFSNPTLGYRSFDDVGHAFLTVFQIVTQQSWHTLLEQTDETTSHASILYYILAIVLLSWIVAPLTLGVYFEKLCRGSRLHTLRQLEFFTLLLNEQRQRMTALVRLRDYVERDGVGHVPHYPTQHAHASRSPATVYHANSSAAAATAATAQSNSKHARQPLTHIHTNPSNKQHNGGDDAKMDCGPLYIYGAGVDVEAVARMVRRRRLKQISWADAQRIQLQLSLTRQRHLVQKGEKLRRGSIFPQSGRTARSRLHRRRHRDKKHRTRDRARSHHAPGHAAHAHQGGSREDRGLRSRSSTRTAVAGDGVVTAATSYSHRCRSNPVTPESNRYLSVHSGREEAVTFALGGSVGGVLHHPDNATRGGAHDGNATFAARQEAVIAQDLRFMHPSHTDAIGSGQPPQQQEEVMRSSSNNSGAATRMGNINKAELSLGESRLGMGEQDARVSSAMGYHLHGTPLPEARSGQPSHAHTHRSPTHGSNSYAHAALHGGTPVRNAPGPNMTAYTAGSRPHHPPAPSPAALPRSEAAPHSTPVSARPPRVPISAKPAGAVAGPHYAATQCRDVIHMREAIGVVPSRLGHSAQAPTQSSTPVTTAAAASSSTRVTTPVLMAHGLRLPSEDAQRATSTVGHAATTAYLTHDNYSTHRASSHPHQSTAKRLVEIVVQDPEGGEIRYTRTWGQKLAIVRNMVHMFILGYPRIITEYRWKHRLMMYRYGLDPLISSLYLENRAVRMLRIQQEQQRWSHARNTACGQGSRWRAHTIALATTTAAAQQQQQRAIAGATGMFASSPSAARVVRSPISPPTSPTRCDPVKHFLCAMQQQQQGTNTDSSCNNHACTGQEAYSLPAAAATATLQAAGHYPALPHAHRRGSCSARCCETYSGDGLRGFAEDDADEEEDDEVEHEMEENDARRAMGHWGLGDTSLLRMTMNIVENSPITPLLAVALAIIVANLCINVTITDTISPTWRQACYITGTVFSAIYLSALLIRLFALGVGPFLTDGLAIVSVVAVVCSIVQLQYTGFNSTALFSLVNLLRLFVSLRYLPLRCITKVFLHGIHLQMYGLIVLTMLMFIFVLIGMNLFGNELDWSGEEGYFTYGNFATFTHAAVAVWQAMLTNRDQWIIFTWKGMQSRGAWTVLYFIVTVLTTYFVRFLFVAIWLVAWKNYVESGETQRSERALLRHLMLDSGKNTKWKTAHNLDDDDDDDEDDENAEYDVASLPWFDFTVWRSFKHIHGGFVRRDVAPDAVYHLNEDMRRELQRMEALVRRRRRAQDEEEEQGAMHSSWNSYLHNVEGDNKNDNNGGGDDPRYPDDVHDSDDDGESDAEYSRAEKDGGRSYQQDDDRYSSGEDSEGYANKRTIHSLHASEQNSSHRRRSNPSAAPVYVSIHGQLQRRDAWWDSAHPHTRSRCSHYNNESSAAEENQGSVNASVAADSDNDYSDASHDGAGRVRGSGMGDEDTGVPQLRFARMLASLPSAAAATSSSYRHDSHTYHTHSHGAHSEIAWRGNNTNNNNNSSSSRSNRASYTYGNYYKNDVYGDDEDDDKASSVSCTIRVGDVESRNTNRRETADACMSVERSAVHPHAEDATHVLLPGPLLRYRAKTIAGQRRVFELCPDCNTHKQLALPAPHVVAQRRASDLHREHCHMAAVRSARQLVLSALFGYVGLQQEWGKLPARAEVEMVLGQAWSCGMLLHEKIDNIYDEHDNFFAHGGRDANNSKFAPSAQKRGRYFTKSHLPANHTAASDYDGCDNNNNNSGNDSVNDKGPQDPWSRMLEALELQQWLLDLRIGEEQVGRATLAYILAHQEAQEERQYERRYGESWREYSLFLFRPSHPFRHYIEHLLRSPAYRIAIMFVVFVSLIYLALHEPMQNGGTSARRKVLSSIDDVVTVLLLVDMAAKWISLGVIWPIGQGYVWSAWRLVEAVVAILSTLAWAGVVPEMLRCLKVIRCVQILDPLRFWRARPDVARVAQAAWNCSTALWSALALTALHYVIWAVVFLSLFSGTMGVCVTNTSVTTRESCLNQTVPNATTQIATPGIWRSPVRNFDTMAQSLLTTFELSTGAEVFNVTQHVMNAWSRSHAMEMNRHPYQAWLLIAYYYMSHFVLFSLVVSCVIFCYFATKNGLAWMSTSHWQFKRMEEILLRLRLRRSILPRPALLPRWLHRHVLRSATLKLTLGCMVLVNVVLMCVTWYGMGHTQGWILYALQGVLNVGFALVVLLRIYTYGTQSFTRATYCCDMFVTVAAIVAWIIEYSYVPSVSVINPNVLRLLRVGGLLHLVRVFSPRAVYMFLVEGVMRSALAELLCVAALHVLMILMYAVVGLHMFGSIEPVPGGFFEPNSYRSFDSFRHAVSMVMRLSTMETWVRVMRDSTPVPHESYASYCNTELQAACGRTQWAPVYYVALFFIMQCVVMGLYAAVVVEYFTVAVRVRVNVGRFYDLQSMLAAWKLRDPEASHRLRTHELASVLEEVRPPLGVSSRGHRGELLRVLWEYDIPDHDGWVWYDEVLWALIHRASNMFIDEMSGSVRGLDFPLSRVRRQVEAELMNEYRFTRSSGSSNDYTSYRYKDRNENNNYYASHPCNMNTNHDNINGSNAVYSTYTMAGSRSNNNYYYHQSTGSGGGMTGHTAAEYFAASYVQASYRRRLARRAYVVEQSRRWREGRRACEHMGLPLQPYGFGGVHLRGPDPCIQAVMQSGFYIPEALVSSSLPAAEAAAGMPLYTRTLARRHRITTIATNANNSNNNYCSNDQLYTRHNDDTIDTSSTVPMMYRPIISGLQRPRFGPGAAGAIQRHERRTTKQQRRRQQRQGNDALTSSTSGRQNTVVPAVIPSLEPSPLRNEIHLLADTP